MGFLVNTLLVITGTICGVCGISFAMREKVVGVYRFYIMGLGIFAALWCVGYGIMGMTFDDPIMQFGRTVGLTGFVGYVWCLTFLMSFVVDVKKSISHIVASILLIGGVYDIYQYSSIKLREFYWYNGRAAYTSLNYHIQDRIHSIYIAICFLVMLILALVWLFNKKKTELKNVVRIAIVAHFILMFTTIPDTFMPMKGYLSFPSSGFGAAIAFLTLWYTGSRFNAFSITIQKVSRDIFETVDVNIFVFDNNYELRLANTTAKKKYNISDYRNDLKLSYFFRMTNAEEEELYKNVTNGIVKDYKTTDRTDGTSVILSFNVAYSSSGKPYGFIVFVYDRTNEEIK